MKYNFCTLFDSNYMQKGLALYSSLKSVTEDFHLYIVAFDDKCYNTLASLNLPNLTVVALTQFENQDLLAVKPTRNRAEYCWTSGPSMIYYFIEKYQLDHCTYVDADLMFFRTPSVIFDEIGECAVAITEHFSEEIDELGGRFCVQFVYFRNDENGMAALKWWRDECINWCFARFEDGKYGDQKYLDYFPEKFKNVKVLENRGAGVANWNAFQYDFSEFGTLIYNKQRFNIVFYHFHGIRIDLIENTLILKTITYDITSDMEKNIFLPYLKLIKSVYTDYLNVKVTDIKIEKRHFIERFYSVLKRKFRNNKFIQFVYYKILKMKYNGYEQNN